MSTANDLVTGALQMVNAIGFADPATAEMKNSALNQLNMIIDLWNADRKLPYVNTVATLNLTTSDTYTIGSGGDINDSIPSDVVQIAIVVGGTEHQIDKKSQYDFNAMTKTSSSGIPDCFTYNLGVDFGRIVFFPAPSGYQAKVTYPKKLGQLVLTDTLSLPDGYYALFMYALAEELLIPYGMAGTAEAVDIRRKSEKAKKILERRNYQSRELEIDRPLRYDINTNTMR